MVQRRLAHNLGVGTDEQCSPRHHTYFNPLFLGTNVSLTRRTSPYLGAYLHFTARLEPRHELDRVGEQVEDHLLEAVAVSLHLGLGTDG